MSSDSSNFKDNQQYKINIEQIYSSLIQQIDNIRSNVSTANYSAKLIQFIKQANSTNPSTKSILSQLQIDLSAPQESRCHAFYRLLGLPVFEQGGTFYSPGLNQESSKKSSYLQFKKNVAANISNNLYNLMDAREINIKNYLKIFSASDINASVLGLSITQAPIRTFNVIQNISTNPFNATLSAQSYSFASTYNFSGTYLLTNYQDSNGKIASGNVLGYLSKRSHIVAPFMVDPRVELTINPPYIGVAGQNNTAICKIVGAPFASNKSELQYIENIYAVRPIIETICRQRLNIAQPTSNLSQRFQDIIAYVENTDLINDSNLLNQVFQNPTQANEDVVFLQYINIIKAMIDKLVEALHIISDTEIEYHWVPIPNIKGPEYGSTTQGIVIGDINNTDKDTTIINAVVKSEIGQINSQRVQTSQPDLGNFTDLQIQPSPDNQTNHIVEDRSQNELNDMITKRTEKTNAANDALKTIEIIMGEFSGFGLCDIIAVYLALWSIDLDSLVSMLDSEAFARLVNIPELQSQSVLNRHSNNDLPISGNDIISVMTNFEQKVSYIYALMDKMLLDRINNNASGNL